MTKYGHEIIAQTEKKNKSIVSSLIIIDKSHSIQLKKLFFFSFAIGGNLNV